ncbi:hypothetical protein [Thiorhodovibrio litoralis]|uniref:hypothetical protein n=1 Tax=Thiorhodovibrio litoralis TaxID=2952932 RepID=UPI002B258087|nr:hypothetical protein [Thiorhodovibrio litoralis]WPL11694.1 hypothetical protein Thiosp_01444 [Thiorhodovibrio litoralis]WPL11934.1 hypothetical protein Thiosp_01687 [Thiorhodovibrio litoralis]WPL14740.1 hypothetical protein Thiosp_04595 [Thiorhodovibrio litoralis]
MTYADFRRGNVKYGLICFDLSMFGSNYCLTTSSSLSFFENVVLGPVMANTLAQGTQRQTATVDHADIRGLGTTGLHCVAELAFL